MSLIAYATPFFLFSMLFELLYGWLRGRNTYRLNDAVGSLFLGVLSQVRRLVVLGLGGVAYHFVAQSLSLWQMDAGHWFTWVLAFVLYDLCYYWLHRMGHERTILWAAHVAHHQSEEYNLSTALRQTSSGWLFGWIFFLPLFALGIPSEVFVTVGSLNLLYQYWVHTRHIGKLGWYESVFVTPSNHRVHHAQNEAYLDRNYGGVFIIWDRLFGTFQEELEDEPCIYGIRGPLHSWNPGWALFHIYWGMVQDSWRTARWRDKLQVWVGRTGWRPADVAERYPRDRTDLSDFNKYDPPMTLVVAAYAMFQLLAVILLGSWLGATNSLDYRAGVVLVVGLFWTTVVTAWWMENRSPLGLDLLRLAAVAAVAWVLAGQGLFPDLLTALLAYGLANLLFLVVLTFSGRGRTVKINVAGTDGGVP